MGDDTYDSDQRRDMDGTERGDRRPTNAPRFGRDRRLDFGPAMKEVWPICRPGGVDRVGLVRPPLCRQRRRGTAIGRAGVRFTRAFSLDEPVEQFYFACLELVEADGAGREMSVERVKGFEHFSF
jgi:hypothetical protein